MKYPRYRKRDNLRCKLTNQNIKTIRYLKEKGVKLKKIANQFKVSTNAIQYWTSKRYRTSNIKRSIKNSMKFTKNNPEKALEAHRKFIKRKIKTTPKYREYINSFQPNTLINKNKLKGLLKKEQLLDNYKIKKTK